MAAGALEIEVEVSDVMYNSVKRVVSIESTKTGGSDTTTTRTSNKKGGKKK